MATNITYRKEEEIAINEAPFQVRERREKQVEVKK